MRGGTFDGSNKVEVVDFSPCRHFYCAKYVQVGSLLVGWITCLLKGSKDLCSLRLVPSMCTSVGRIYSLSLYL